MYVATIGIYIYIYLFNISIYIFNRSITCIHIDFYLSTTYVWVQVCVYVWVRVCVFIPGAETGLVLLVPGTTNNSVNVIQNGLKIIH